MDAERYDEGTGPERDETPYGEGRYNADTGRKIYKNAAERQRAYRQRIAERDAWRRQVLTEIEAAALERGQKKLTAQQVLWQIEDILNRWRVRET